MDIRVLVFFICKYNLECSLVVIQGTETPILLNSPSFFLSLVLPRPPKISHNPSPNIETIPAGTHEEITLAASQNAALMPSRRNPGVRPRHVA